MKVPQVHFVSVVTAFHAYFRPMPELALLAVEIWPPEAVLVEVLWPGAVADEWLNKLALNPDQLEGAGNLPSGLEHDWGVLWVEADSSVPAGVTDQLSQGEGPDWSLCVLAAVPLAVVELGSVVADRASPWAATDSVPWVVGSTPAEGPLQVVAD